MTAAISRIDQHNAGALTSNRYHGMLQILRFNWPWYAGALVLPFICLLVWRTNALPGLRFVVLAGAGCAWFWAATSLWVSHWVYDRSPLLALDWIPRLIVGSPTRMANIHAGFDESSDALARQYPAAAWQVWDIYQAAVMTEHSIERARQVNTQAPRAVSVDLQKLPEIDHALDAVFVIFAAHEIRSASTREQFFTETHRILKPGGTLLLVEHLRDWKNFLAYGPGYFHFVCRQEWLRLAGVAGFSITHELSITPFVRVFALTKSN